MTSEEIKQVQVNARLLLDRNSREDEKERLLARAPLWEIAYQLAVMNEHQARGTE